jgi:asparagine synthase (glutamine-hydrolysing)
LCGIAGIADPSGRPLSESDLRDMCDAMIHRGPDGEGYYASPAGRAASVGLGMRRLAVIDLITGQQPIHNEDKTIWVVLNGEIYNYPELRADLESKGHIFYTKSDTEVIVHAYEEYGKGLPRRLRGMFAFALWDERRESLMLARDRIGKKPLLYSISGGALVFASEFQALLRHPAVSRDINLEAIPHYLAFMCVPGPETAFTAIKKLDPGCLLIWSRGSVTTERYWSLEFEHKIQISEQEAADRTVELLKDAVKVRLMSDVPLGAFLSGGIDSSAVVALMSELHPGRVQTFTIGFDEQDFSEIEHARRVAARFGSSHHEFIVRPDAIEVLPTLVRHYGEPYADSSAIPTYYLSKLTRQHVTVALNGDGGDEAFAGYERYAAMRLADRYHSIPGPLRRAIMDPLIAAIPDKGTSRSLLGKARRFARVAGRERADRYLRWSSTINEDMKRELFTKRFLDQVRESSSLPLLDQWFAGNGHLDIVDRALKADTETYLPNDLLVKVDIASMAVSLEARSPFLDHHLLEFAASLPAGYKLRCLTTKHLLKRALKGLLPPENLKRGKMGFGVPIGLWLRGDLRELLRDAILSEQAARRGYFSPDAVRVLYEQHQSRKRDWGHQLWTLLMLELWHREFVDRSRVD